MDDDKTRKGQILLYQVIGGGPRLELQAFDEDVWLTVNQMAVHFQEETSVISRHLKNIFESGELDRNSVVVKKAITAADGKTYQVDHLNLDAVIYVGYRINSLCGTQFRIWATQKLKDYLIKGFLLDDQRFKEVGSDRYFEELLAHIEDIRSSERAFYRKAMDIYSTSVDYDSEAAITEAFIKKVLNKMNWATNGHPASVEANKGTANFPDSKLLKRDKEASKICSFEDELELLNRLVTAYLEVAEIKAQSRQLMYMADWSKRLDPFLSLTGQELLELAETIIDDQAKSKAFDESEKFKSKLLSAPTEVENHFINAEQTLKEIESAQKKPFAKQPSVSGPKKKCPPKK
jgi:hypothetical protein